MSVRVRVPAADELLDAVRGVVADADEALLCVAFANPAGVNLLEPALKAARGRVRLLSTTVFGDSTAAALSRAADLGVDVRILNPGRGTYHPKLYLARRRDRTEALVGSANLTSGLLRNIELATVLDGASTEPALARLRETAERWWTHPAAVPWTPVGAEAPGDRFDDDLWPLLRAAVPPGTTVLTLTRGQPNRIVELSRDTAWVETERSRSRGEAGEPIPAWMFNTAWDYLTAHRRLSNSFLVATDGLNVKRSSAVCAILAHVPGVEVVGRRPIELAWRPAAAAAAEEPSAYRPGGG